MHNNEGRFLILILILSKYSNDREMLDFNKINNHLLENNCNILAKKTLTNHINTIKELEESKIWNDFFGELIIEKKFRKNVFNIANIFEESELRVLSDLICYSKALSKFESERLIEKINKITNFEEAVRIKGKLKSIEKSKTNSNILSNISNILEAIKTERKISFNYCQYDYNQNLVCKKDQNNNKEYIASVVDIFIKKDFYYLALKKNNKEGIANYRIDKICNIKLLDEKTEINRENFDLVEHIRKDIYMFSGKKEKVELVVKKGLKDLIIDEFGRDCKITYKGEYLIVVIEVAINQGLISWILQLGENCEVKSPEILRLKITEQLEKILIKYR